MMNRGQRSLVWVQFAISAGILLGITLLIQTITTYFFVYNRVINDEAYREAERQESTLVKLANRSNIREPEKLTPILKELHSEASRKVAWLRIIDMEGDTLAEAGTPLANPPSATRIRRQLETHLPMRREISSTSGKISISLLRFRLGPFPPDHLPAAPPNRRRSWDKGGPPFNPGMGPGPLTFAEIAVYQDRVSIPFGDLRRNLIIGCLASVVLLASMVLIGLLFTRFLHARQLEQQVELARTVQTGLLPSPQQTLVPNTSVDFSAVFVPASSIGGDFYDIFTAEDGRTAMVLGDVAGKGVSAALLMGVLHGAIRSLNWTANARQHEESTVKLNHFLCEKTARERFASLFWAYFTPETGTLRYINAGHLPPLLIHAGGGTERLGDGGPVLGLLPAAQFRSHETQVEAGDLLIVFSDGIAEAMNQKEEEFGDERIVKIARQNLAQSPQLICHEIVQSINRFIAPLKPHDDQTLLIVRLTAVGAAKDSARLPHPETMPV